MLVKNICLKNTFFIIFLPLSLAAIVFVTAGSAFQNLYDPTYNVYLHVSGDYNEGQNYFYKTIHYASVGAPAGYSGSYHFYALMNGVIVYNVGNGDNRIVPFSVYGENSNSATYAVSRASNSIRNYEVSITR